MMLLITKWWWTLWILLMLTSIYSCCLAKTSNNLIAVIVDNRSANVTYCNEEHHGGVADNVVCVTSFNMALQEIQDTGFSNIWIQVNPGNYTLEYRPENNITCHHTGNNGGTLTITGTDLDQTILNCEPLAGIYIYDCFNVTLEYITLNHCGYDHQLPLSTSFSDSTVNSYSLQPAAVAIAFSHYATLANVTIRHSQGSGILLHSFEATISDCLITGGSGFRPIKGSISGSIVLFNFNRKQANAIAMSSVSITGSRITNNDYSHVTPIIEGIAFGGAALTVLELPTALFEVDSCVITNNSRGLFIYNHKSIELDSNTDSILRFNKVLMSHNWNDSVIILDKSGKRQLNLFDIIINETIIVDQQRYYQDAYLTDSLDTSIQCSSHCRAPSIQFNYRYIPLPENDTYIPRPVPGICTDNDTNGDFTSKCPIPYSAKVSVSISENVDQLYGRNGFKIVRTNYTCWGNRHGDLCSQCIEDHSVAINSPYLSCVPCDSWQDVLRGWVLLVLLEFIPVTVMVAVIALLNVNLNQGSLNAYVFFCQIFTIPFPSVGYPSWYVINYNFNQRNFDFYLFPFSMIWNLGFIIYPTCYLSTNHDGCNKAASICISRNTTAVGAISIWYLITLYPFLLLFIVYLCVIGYNKGHQCIVCVIRPIHRLLARFWRMFDIQPSLPTTVASVYTLCFTQLAATSLKLLHGTTYKNEIVFFYDGSQRYFKTIEHGLAVIAALIVLIVFIIVPVVYLSVYPFKWFQLCLNRVKIRKDMLISVTDVFTAPYSNGVTKDKRDYRYFAGMHFIFQLVAMCFYYVNFPTIGYYGVPRSDVVILVAHQFLCSITILLLVLFRPYKRLSHVITDVLSIALLFILSLNNVFRPILFESVLTILAILIFYLYTFFAFCYCIRWMHTKSQQHTVGGVLQCQLTLASSCRTSSTLEP